MKKGDIVKIVSSRESMTRHLPIAVVKIDEAGALSRGQPAGAIQVEFLTASGNPISWWVDVLEVREI